MTSPLVKRFRYFRPLGLFFMLSPFVAASG
jgi:hypothetical protein